MVIESLASSMWGANMNGKFLCQDLYSPKCKMLTQKITCSRGSASFSFKETESKYFRLCWLYSVTKTTLLL